MNTETVGQKLIRLVSRIVLCRHGKAVEIKPTDKDENRQLNALGLAQAVKLGKNLDQYHFDLALSSPLPRARLTLAIATFGQYPIHDVPELTCSTEPDSPIDVMWEELGHVPLKEYKEHRLYKELESWANRALDAILEKTSSLCHGRRRQQIVCSGHAVLQNALADRIGQALCQVQVAGGAQVRNLASTKILSEGEAFSIAINLIGKTSAAMTHLRI